MEVKDGLTLKEGGLVIDNPLFVHFMESVADIMIFNKTWDPSICTDNIFNLSIKLHGSEPLNGNPIIAKH